MGEYLPEQMVVEILRRLPPTTLVKCTSVCKAWNTLIKSPAFISSHLQHSLSNPNRTPLLFRQQDQKEVICSAVAPNFPTIAEFDYPSWIPGAFNWELTASLHGIVCIFDIDEYCTGRDFHLLWNPFIRRYLLLPIPLFSGDSIGLFNVYHGFGFDSNSNDYKLLRLCYCYNDEYEFDVTLPPHAELYSLNQDSWRVIDATYVEFAIVCNTGQTNCFLHGNVHWLGCERLQNSLRYARPEDKTEQYCKCVLTFDVEEEKFKTMELPAELLTVSQLNFVISVIDGCLSVVENSPYGDSVSNITWYNVWMMREYGEPKSWSKMYSIDLEGGLADDMVLWKSDEALVISHEETVSLHSFQPKAHAMQSPGEQKGGNKH